MILHNQLMIYGLTGSRMGMFTGPVLNIMLFFVQLRRWFDALVCMPVCPCTQNSFFTKQVLLPYLVKPLLL